MERFTYYKLSKQKEDHDMSVLFYTKAIFLQPVSRPGPFLNIVQILFHLAFALLVRSEEFEQPHDIKYSIEYLRYLRGLGPILDSFDIPGKTVVTVLLRALAIQVRLDAGDGTQDIKEMVALCRELLASNIFTVFPVGAFVALDEAVFTEYNRRRSIQSLDEAIECLRDAMRMCPQGSHLGWFPLARSLFIRFFETYSNIDYEDAMALLERILDPNQLGEFLALVQFQAAELAALLAIARWTIFRDPESSEVAISRLRALLSYSSIDEGLRFHVTSFLWLLIGERSRQYSLAESFQEAKSYQSQFVDLSSSQSPAQYGPTFFRLYTALGNNYDHPTTTIQQRIQYLEELHSIDPPGTSGHDFRLRELSGLYIAKFSHTNDISDIEESIKYQRLRLNATHSDGLRVRSLCSLSDLLLAFEQTNKINYLDESIILGYDMLKLKSARDEHFHVILGLASSLLTRSRLLGRREDIDEAFHLMPLAIGDQYEQEHDRFRLSCKWAFLARRIRHPSVLTAYKSALSLVHKSLSFAPTVLIQHTRLVAMGEECQRMPLDYASYQIDLGQFEEAVETLEQGRALLWSEMRGLRTPMAQFHEDSSLAKRFTEINQELEALTTSLTPSARLEMEDGVTQGRDLTDPFGRFVVKQQKLVEERDALISQIQGRPGLEGFLRAPSFTTLRSAASRGPVILINHCIWRSDILILFHNSLPCAIPTADDFYDRANNLRDELVEARKHGLDSVEYQDALCFVLKGLYRLVGKPVIKRLRVLGVPEQSRIWWCPTSVFCSLPLHAMGPIPSSDTSERYFSDLYISSYTPSLSALIESRKASPQTLDKPTLLLVAQPDDSLPGVKGEIKVIRKLEERVTVTGLVSSEATPSSVVEGLRGSRLAHFACHGVLETGKPFEASFRLYGGSRLTLLDMVRSRLPDAEFAFLSCCHAAEITEESIADEALHLTAAMQYCGFRSVVGTMWEMADTDGRDLAKTFYKSLFSSEEPGVPYYERTAEALRDATRKLREKRGISLERWVNFVHYGS